MKDFLDSFIKAIGLLTLILITLGYASTYLYYHLFEIDIHRYIEPSEIILLFMSSNFNLLATIFFYVLVFSAMYISKQNSNSKIILGIEFKKNQDSNWWSRFIQRPLIQFFTLRILYPIASLLVVIFLVYKINYDTAGFVKQFPPNDFSSDLTLLFSLVLFPTISVIAWFSLKNDERKMKLAALILFSLSLVSLFMFNSYVKFIFVSRKFQVTDVELILKERPSIKTNDSLFFIGSTREYYFFKNVKAKKVRVIPSSQIIEENIGN
jgi:hypothetical protein